MGNVTARTAATELLANKFASRGISPTIAMRLARERLGMEMPNAKDRIGEESTAKIKALREQDVAKDKDPDFWERMYAKQGLDRYGQRLAR